VTRSQLRAILSEDPRFASLDFQCNCTKCVVVRVHGTVAVQSDLLDLRKRIFAGCPSVSGRWLYWKATVEQSGSTCEGCDLELFGAPPGRRLPPDL
jgi:hypothetical protein